MPSQVSHIIAAEEALLRAEPRLAESWGIDRRWAEGAPGVGAPAGSGSSADGEDRFAAGGGRFADGVGRSADGPAAWYRLGAQGPDIFYHNQRTKPSGIHYGVLSHKRNYGLAVEAMARALGGAGDDADPRLLAWLLGFATHAAVDRVIHPFIVYFSGWQSPLVPESARYRSCHPFLERLLDIDILGRTRGIDIGECNLETLLPLEGRTHGPDSGAPSIDTSIVQLLTTGLRAAFPAAAGADFLIERRIRNALADARYFYRIANPSLTSSGSDSLLPWFDDRSGWRSMALIYPERLPAGLDVDNEATAEWEHPAGDGRSSRLRHVELFEAAIERAAESLTTVARAVEGHVTPPGFAATIGNGGLSVTDETGIPVPPRVSRPLPLMEAMETEFERRIRAERNRGSGSPENGS